MLQIVLTIEIGTSFVFFFKVRSIVAVKNQRRFCFKWSKSKPLLCPRTSLLLPMCASQGISQGVAAKATWLEHSGVATLCTPQCSPMQTSSWSGPKQAPPQVNVVNAIGGNHNRLQPSTALTVWPQFRSGMEQSSTCSGVQHLKIAFALSFHCI